MDETVAGASPVFDGEDSYSDSESGVHKKEEAKETNNNATAEQHPSPAAEESGTISPRKQRRLRLNRESARRRRQEKKVLERSLARQVSELTQRCRADQLANQILASEVDHLQSELAVAHTRLALLTHQREAHQGAMGLLGLGGAPGLGDDAETTNRLAGVVDTSLYSAPTRLMPLGVPDPCSNVLPPAVGKFELNQLGGTLGCLPADQAGLPQPLGLHCVDSHRKAPMPPQQGQMSTGKIVSSHARVGLGEDHHLPLMEMTRARRVPDVASAQKIQLRKRPPPFLGQSELQGKKQRVTPGDTP